MTCFYLLSLVLFLFGHGRHAFVKPETTNGISQTHNDDILIKQSQAKMTFPKSVGSKGSESNQAPQYISLSAASSLFQTQPTRFRQDFSTLPVVVNADRISRLLRKLANEDMGVYSMQTILDGMLYRSDNFDHTDEVRKMAEAVDQTQEEARKIVNEIRRAALASFAKSSVDTQMFGQYRECCALDKRWLTFSARHSSRVNSSYTCDILPQRRLSAFTFSPGKDLTQTFARLAERDSAVRWQYFITADGVHTEYPAHGFDDRYNFSRCLARSRYRRWNAFVAAALPFPKTVIIMIDRGSGVSQTQLETGKCVAKALISAMNENDKVVVMAVGGSVIYQQNCQQHKRQSPFLFASQAVKARLSYFIDSLSHDGERSNHTQAFEVALEIFARFVASYSNANRMQNVFPTVIYISRGLLTEITEAKQVLGTIMDGVRRVYRAFGDDTSTGRPEFSNLVQINTIALMERGKLVMWETQFLQDIASQNFSKYKLSLTEAFGHGGLEGDVESKGDAKTIDVRSASGKLLMVNASSNGGLACIALTDVISLFEHTNYDRTAHTSGEMDGDNRNSQVHFLLTDEIFESAFISAVVDVHYEGRFIGVAGVDLALSDMLSSAIYYTSSDTSSYAIVTDSDGSVLYHPKLNQDDSRMRVGSAASVPLTWLEEWSRGQQNQKAALELEQAIANQWYGFFDLEVDDMANGSKPDRNYYWHKTADRSLTFIISAMESPVNQNKKLRQDSKVYIQHTLTYHRLDFRLNKDVRLCYHGKSLASYERAGIFLSPRAFDRPNERRLMSETKQSAQGYWAYTTDDTRLITNPGLKRGIRHEAAAFSKIASEWKKQTERSSYRLSVVRRYLATPSGILLSFPAAVVDKQFDPLNTAWYRNAMQNPGRVILSDARLDPNGFGHLVTISHTVYEGKSAMHQPDDNVVAVMAIDVPLTFVYRLLYDSLSVCRENSIDCFLFNEYGYIVANRNAFTMDDQMSQQTVQQFNGQAQLSIPQQSPVEMMHLAHREPSVASEILQRKGFAVKTNCVRYGDQTVQRYYMFNTSFTDVLRSSDGCLRYQIVAVPQTNVFLAMVNKSCHRHSSFCPCSVNDRRCLNCHRGIVEPSESWCECPCECPLNLADDDRLCHRQANGDRLEIPDACQAQPTPERPPVLDAQFISSVGNTLSSCLSIHCGSFDSESACRGVMGCEWCSYDVDGRQPLKTPYCSVLNSCFGGIQGLAAYSEEDTSYDPVAVSTPVGPVVGGIMGIFVLLVAGVYWYRHHVLRLVESRHGRYGSSGSASCLQRFDDSAEEGYHFDDGSGGNGGDDKGPLNTGNALLLASFERENLGAGQAPRPRYRPGPRTESSDHGYSTMTGNCDDSEQATTIEPLGNNGVRPFAKVFIRWPAIIGHRANNASIPSSTLGSGVPNKITKPASTTLGEPTDLIGATVLPNESILVQETNISADDPLHTSITSDSSASVPGSTNIVTMALIHHQPIVAET